MGRNEYFKKEIKQNTDDIGYYESVRIIWHSSDKDDKRKQNNGCIFMDLSFEFDDMPTFGDLLERAKKDGFNEKCGCVTVLLESYTYGDVYRYGNYQNDKSWRKIGILEGFA